MANESKPGHEVKVTIGANNILGMGVWSHSGYSREMLDDTEFGDEYDDFEYGVMHPGTLSFNGKYKKDDTQGQDILRSYMVNEVDLTDIKFYVDSVSYQTPNSTTAAGGGLLAGEPVAYCIVSSIDTTFDKSALGDISFVVQLCAGPMRLV
jgi:hypothetical protein